MARSAARVWDGHTCPLPRPIPHAGGPILPPAAPHTEINGRPAARVGDKAHCAVPTPDTVRGGLITVFIDGMPAARRLDMTDVGTIITGSPDVLLGESAGEPLTPFQAQWLYTYLNCQTDGIAFEFADDGCHARADRMATLMASLGISVEKQWLRATRASGKLKVAIKSYPQGGVTWLWHVAPVVQVSQPDGLERMVIDPSLGFGRPVSVREWIRKQSSKPTATVTGSTSKDVYQRGWNDSTESWNDSGNVPSDPDTTRRDLNRFREARATRLPIESGRKIPNWFIHYE